MADNKLFAVILIIVAVIAGYYFLKPVKTVTQDSGGIPTQVINDVCLAREGLEMGICCADFDDETQTWNQVDCFDNNVQSMWWFEKGNMIRRDGVSFAFRINNTGNIPFDAILVDSNVSGPSGGLQELSNKASYSLMTGSDQTTKLMNDVPPNSYGTVGMRISQPVDVRTLPDGTYRVCYKVQVEGVNGLIYSWKCADLKVLQEVVSFSTEIIAS